MKKIFEEYGGVIVGTAAAAFLLALAIRMVFGGEIYKAVQEFSKSIC